MSALSPSPYIITGIVSCHLMGGLSRVRAGEAGLGILVGPQVCAESRQDFDPQVQLVVIEFSSAGDGRGFSLAGYVRRAGFTGEMRARGPLTPEQYPHLTACGFDTVEVPEELAQRHGELSWRRCFGAYPNRYQSALGTRASIVQQRVGDMDSRAAQRGEELV